MGVEEEGEEGIKDSQVSGLNKGMEGGDMSQEEKECGTWGTGYAPETSPGGFGGSRVMGVWCSEGVPVEEKINE